MRRTRFVKRIQHTWTEEGMLGLRIKARSSEPDRPTGGYIAQVTAPIKELHPGLVLLSIESSAHRMDRLDTASYSDVLDAVKLATRQKPCTIIFGELPRGASPLISPPPISNANMSNAHAMVVTTGKKTALTEEALRALDSPPGYHMGGYYWKLALKSLRKRVSPEACVIPDQIEMPSPVSTHCGSPIAA